MDINMLLEGAECSCGKTHRCNIEHVYIEKKALNRLPEICQEYKNILIVADENTYSVAGDLVKRRLECKKIQTVIFNGSNILIPDENAISKVNEQILNVDLIIGVGSGVIQDLCKYVSYFSKVPYMVVATAPSMDGYASDGAAMILKGMKETVKAVLPKAIIADIEIMKDAPLEMIKAGFGDIIGKYSALCDWKLSSVVNGEYFCQYIYDTTYDMIQNTLDTANGLLKRDEKSIKALMEALIVVGIMMSFAGSSRPASGSEHHLSHFFEIMGIINAEPYFPHGIDVAYSTVVTAQIRENILKKAFSDKLYRISMDEYMKKMQEIYKNVADECIALQNRVGNYTAKRLNVYKQKEVEIREILAQMPKAEEIKEMLSFAEIDISEFYEMYGEKKIKDAVLYAKDLKDRYTVLWLNYDIGGGYKNE